MATDIGFLTPGLDGYVIRVGIGRKGLRKTLETFTILFFFLVHSLSIVDSVAIALSKRPIP
jgi:hypothetical protein